MKKRILFLCTHNSCRSQMAEGLVNHFFDNRFLAYSAGTSATEVHPLAKIALQELGVDISGHRSKTIDEFDGQAFDYVITLCGAANEQCPLHFGGVERVHIGFEDPSLFTGSQDVVLPEFRRIRDEILRVLTDFFKKEDHL